MGVMGICDVLGKPFDLHEHARFLLIWTSYCIFSIPSLLANIIRWKYAQERQRGVENGLSSPGFERYAAYTWRRLYVTQSLHPLCRYWCANSPQSLLRLWATTRRYAALSSLSSCGRRIFRHSTIVQHSNLPSPFRRSGINDPHFVAHKLWSTLPLHLYLADTVALVGHEMDWNEHTWTLGAIQKMLLKWKMGNLLSWCESLYIAYMYLGTYLNVCASYYSRYWSTFARALYFAAALLCIIWRARLWLQIHSSVGQFYPPVRRTLM